MHGCCVHQCVIAESRRIRHESVVQHGCGSDHRGRVPRKRNRATHRPTRCSQIASRAHVCYRLIDISFVRNLACTRRRWHCRSARKRLVPTDCFRPVQVYDRRIVRLGRQFRIHVLQRYRLRRQPCPRACFLLPKASPEMSLAQSNTPFSLVLARADRPRCNKRPPEWLPNSAPMKRSAPRSLPAQHSSIRQRPHFLQP